MHRRLAWMPALLATLPLAAAGNSTVVHDHAEVGQLGKRRLLYRESHDLPDDSPREHRVLAPSPDGTPSARKRVTASTQPMAPNFRLEDGRDGYREGVRGCDGQRVVYAGTGAGDARACRCRSTPRSTPASTVRCDATGMSGSAAMRCRCASWCRAASSSSRCGCSGSTPAAVARRTMGLRMRLATWFGFAMPDVRLIHHIQHQCLLAPSETGTVRDALNRYPQVPIALSPRRKAHPPTSSHACSASRSVAAARFDRAWLHPKVAASRME